MFDLRYCIIGNATITKKFSAAKISFFFFFYSVDICRHVDIAIWK